MNQKLDLFLRASPAVPVVVIDNADHAIPLARALLEGGIGVIEITLRSDAALKSIEHIAREVPQIQIAVGTITNPDQLQAASNAGAHIAISPGLTEKLLLAADTLNVPLLPGIASASDLMLGMEAGLQRFKLFPASVINGIELAKALYGPFPNVRFCPTGGISIETAANYLAVPNILCVGISSIASREDIQTQNWSAISAKASQAIKLRLS
jgi:2-dehydro-3-deoxyphosphogluconate aldolase / (4S)-4-hydroxy-2-oxoglutarate aldolase